MLTTHHHHFNVGVRQYDICTSSKCPDPPCKCGDDPNAGKSTCCICKRDWFGRVFYRNINGEPVCQKCTEDG